MRIPHPHHAPRMFPGWLLAAALLALVWWLAPPQLPVVAFKAGLVILGGVAGYLLDRWAFPYARPHSYLAADWHGRKFAENEADNPVVIRWEQAFLVACGRRAFIMGAAMLAVGLGL